MLTAQNLCSNHWLIFEICHLLPNTSGQWGSLLNARIMPRCFWKQKGWCCESKHTQGEKPALSSTLELPLALGRLQGGTEVLQVSTLSLVHEVEELPEHRDWQRAKGHLRHKQPNAKSAHFKRQQEKFYILESFTTVRKWKEDIRPHITTTFPTHTWGRDGYPLL